MEPKIQCIYLKRKREEKSSVQKISSELEILLTKHRVTPEKRCDDDPIS